MLTKTNFIESLSHQFRVSSHWRKRQAKRYLYDARNGIAAERLLELESQIVIPDHIWKQLAPLVSGPACLAVISETNRDVAFRRHPCDFSAWLENLLSNLTCQGAE